MEMKITFSGNQRVDASYDGIVIRTDQPVSAGGDGSAPEPFKLFLASIGTCAGIYVLSYCKSHDLPTEGLYLTEDVRWNAAEHRVGAIDIAIHAPAGFPERHLKALERSAELCAVKKAIANPPEFGIKATIG
jgi:ribosomal protein S12 methylthiotransferase accessory factor